MVAIFAVCAETLEEVNRVASSLDLSILLLEKGERSQWKGTPSIQQAMDYPYTDYDRVRIQSNRNRMIVGNPEQVKSQILKLCEDYHTSEIMIASIVHDFEDKLKSYQWIADAFK
jgi:alkanesulfonate monooxygenase SsuD/methylene tetrahydromethanopterin reductase-like flavin-dependent oxidoreductase (luciferase family)